jgi:hypothetical protein
MVQRSPTNGTRRQAVLPCSRDLADEIASLSALCAGDLRQRCIALFGSDPSPRLGRTFIIRAVAYRLQERAFGAIKPSLQRFLDRIYDHGAEVALEHIPKPKPGAGTVLIREWRGVAVLDH